MATRDGLESDSSRADDQGGASDSSLALLELARAGDRRALDVLLTRHRPRLRRWAARRLPAGARGMIDTDDIVQDTLMRAVNNLDGFAHRGKDAFLAYCLEALRNRLRDEYRRCQTRPVHDLLDESLISQAPSPLECALQSATFDCYERALHTLAPERQEAIIARFELGYSHAEVAVILGKPGADAARKFIARAVMELAAAMKNNA